MDDPRPATTSRSPAEHGGDFCRSGASGLDTRTSVEPSRHPARPAAIGLLLLAAVLTLTACGVREIEPRTSPAQLDFGVDMARRGLWSEALFRFQQAEKMAPGDPRILNNVAVAYEALGQFENALEYYQNAIKASPGNKDLRRNYSRFVEFYRAFRPDQQADASLDD